MLLYYVQRDGRLLWLIQKISISKYKSHWHLFNLIAYILLNVAEILDMSIVYKQAKIGC